MWHLGGVWNVKICSKNIRSELKYAVDFLSAYLVRVPR